jgi:sugar phosphate permease
MYRAAARRFSLLLLAVVGGTVLLALPIGLLLGASVARSVSVGWYMAGSILLLLGFFVGNRGAARPEAEGWFAFSTRRNVRWADADEQQESISLSAVVVTLGFVLLVLGAVADTRYNLF